MLSNPPYGKSWKSDLERMGGGDIALPAIGSPMRFKRELDEAKGRAESARS